MREIKLTLPSRSSMTDTHAVKMLEAAMSDNPAKLSSTMTKVEEYASKFPQKRREALDIARAMHLATFAPIIPVYPNEKRQSGTIGKSVRHNTRRKSAKWSRLTPDAILAL